MLKSRDCFVLWALIVIGAGAGLAASPAVQADRQASDQAPVPPSVAPATPAAASGPLTQSASGEKPPQGQKPPAGQKPEPAPAPTPAKDQKPASGRVLWCGQEIGPPPAERLPKAGSGPVIYQIGVCFPDQGGVSVIDPETYLYYIHTKTSTPSSGVWIPWNETTSAEALRQDFQTLWATKFLDNLSIEVTDLPFENGVVGKLIAFNMEERQRVKIVDYIGAKHLEQSKIDEKLKEENAEIRLDTFIDPGVIRKVKKVVLDMLAEKGYQFASVAPEVKVLPGGPKLVNLTFLVDEGPQVKIRDLVFIGNKAIPSSTLKRQMKNNKGRGLFAFITGAGPYQEGKFEEDADRVVAYYRDRGYIGARVSEPSLRYIEDSLDRRSRWVELRVEVTEGERYRIATFSFEGNKVVKSEALRPLFKVKEGDWYSDKVIRKGYEKARELYGAGGYYQFNLVPLTKPHTEGAATPEPAKGPEGAAAADPEQAGGPSAPAQVETKAVAQPAAQPAAPAKTGTKARKLPTDAPMVDVVLQVDEGKQYFIDRITFTGNTTTRDTVVRREIRLYEEGVFNTEALKFSIKRINQLAYFKQLEGTKDVDVKEAPGTDNKMNITLKLEEQNRNQIQFGAGVSQYEGFFGTLGFQTANFLGRGETFSVNLQAGTLAQNYQVSFTEPYLFDRAITGGVSLFKRKLDYQSQFTQSSWGGDIIFGFPIKDFTRLFLDYSYEHTSVVNVNTIYQDPSLVQNNPYLAETLLLGVGGARTISKIIPSVVYNTIDNPLFPTTGKKMSLTAELAGLGGDTNFWKPSVEATWYMQQSKRTSIGLHAMAQYIAPFSGSKTLPITELLYAGGEYSVRGFDLRTIGPRALTTVPPNFNGSTFLPILMPGDIPLESYQADSGLVLGGNKLLLFNAEYLIQVAGPVRLVLFYDAGQVRDFGQKLAMSEFRTSTGAEVRFFMPVLNVPFRLIFAYNPRRAGILDSTLQPQSAFAFKFAVGSTF
jgi:outer membrane protein insertion porin family